MTDKKIHIEFKFRNTKENGGLRNTVQQCEVPAFDWESFKNLPNTELFVRRAFYSYTQKLVRDVLLNDKNGTTEHHFQSVESVIARSFNFKKSEIEAWCKSRNWNSSSMKNPEENIVKLTEILPRYAFDDEVISDKEIRARVAEIIAEVADRKTDDIAEYLWVKLTQEQKVNFPLEML